MCTVHVHVFSCTVFIDLVVLYSGHYIEMIWQMWQRALISTMYYFLCLYNFIILSVSKKKSSYCDRLVIVVVVVFIVVVMQKLQFSPFLKKVLKVSPPNLEYLHIMTRCSCKTRGITLKTIVLEFCYC